MDLATVLSIVQTILTAIQTLDQLKSTFSLSKYKDQLERLEKTVSIVQSVLVDADDKQGALSRQQMTYIEELKDAIYDANDVLDEFVTLVKQRRVEAVNETHNNLSDKVRSFLSRFNVRIQKLSRKVENVNKKLDEIASTSSKFLFKVDNKPKRFIKPDSYSFVAENDIIGRDKELEKIVGMLLNSNGIVDQANNVSCLAIVGMGGLGKTAFAQLVYNDPRVSSAFDLQRWICIADQDHWNLTEILGKIVKVSISSDRHDSTSLEQMHLKIRKQLEGKKYLLVFDDVWTESYHSWQDLEKILRVGASGSHIIVTTRSKKTAKIIADVRVHELQGLPKEQSWRLFERTAFLPGQRENLDDDLVQLGKEIVKKCKNVPLAIRVVASLLRGEPKLKWISFRDKELANISESDDTIINILKLSYHQLDFSLKSCFSYCAIFPKDFVIDKQMLISLWMAQGYISAEYVGEEYFVILFQRCFFQDLEMNKWGEFRRFKIHDLLHDVAEQVAGKDICRLSSDAFGMSERVHYLSLLAGYCPQETFYNSHIRSCVQVGTLRDKSSSDQLLVGNKIANWTCLRSLVLSDLRATSIPESIGKLFQLRYLNVSRSKLYALPVSITKLVNLQILDLSDCINLLELPKKVAHLLDLRALNLRNCKNLSHMPSGMGSLAYLHTLDLFVVGRRTLQGKHSFDALEELRHMRNLKGFLQVRVWVDEITNYHGKGAFLSNKESLKTLHIRFITLDILGRKKDIPFKDRESAKGLLEDLQPHHGLKELSLEGYIGEIMPRWPRTENNLASFHLPNLVTLNISDCFFLRCLPPLGDLPHLKDLTLQNLPNVEYVLDAKPEESGLGEGSSLFPSLQNLEISYLGKLKGWWPRLRSGLQKKHLVVSLPVPCFPQLKHLDISSSLMLDSFPVSSNLENVSINQFSRAKVWDHMDVLRGFLLNFTASDSKTRMMSICDFESNINNDIDTKLTTALHHWMPSQTDLYHWMSRHGYKFLRPDCQG